MQSRKCNYPADRPFIDEKAGKMGLGTAYCQGFEYVISLGYDIIIKKVDFPHDPNDIRRFLDEIQKYDLVIGSRYSNGVNVVNWPLSRLILSYSANIYTRVITGMPIMDATGGFKCFRASALSKIDFSKIHSNGYAFQIEMNYRLWISGARIKEIPIIFNDKRQWSFQDESLYCSRSSFFGMENEIFEYFR